VTLDEATRLLAEAGIDNPRAEARLLLAHVLDISRDQTLNATPTPDQLARFAHLVTRRAAHEPFAYITGRKEFWSLSFEVGPGVLVPRPDSETLIEEALRLVPDRNAPLKIADLGTGSGALLIAALEEFPNASGAGFESSSQAFACATANAARLIGERAQIRLADWNSAQGPFDLVFCNPPYIPSGDIESLAPDVARYEPHAALDGGPDGLDAYRGLAVLLPRILAPGGHALLEIGLGQANAMEPLFQGVEIVRIAPDLAGTPRCVILRKPQGFPWKNAGFGLGSGLRDRG
jgi:release factor glutamine methyltransferase